MRQIKFRGLLTSTKQWIIGDLYQDGYSGKVFITEFIGIESGESITELREVIPESLGQFTGLHDENGVDIYDGDMLKRTISFMVEEGNQPSIYYDKVVYSGGGFKTVRVDDENRGLGYLENYVGHTIEVIGNIHTDTNSK